MGVKISLQPPQFYEKIKTRVDCHPPIKQSADGFIRD